MEATPKRRRCGKPVQKLMAALERMIVAAKQAERARDEIARGAKRRGGSAR